MGTQRRPSVCPQRPHPERQWMRIDVGTKGRVKDGGGEVNGINMERGRDGEGQAGWKEAKSK